MLENLHVDTPYIAKPTLKMSFSIACQNCDFRYSNTYHRQDPDALLDRLQCPHCKTQTIYITALTPFTVFYQDRSLTHASFLDDISRKCWECGGGAAAHTVTFSTGLQVHLCFVHFKKYQKNRYKRSSK